jgi:hypothetical protein
MRLGCRVLTHSTSALLWVGDGTFDFMLKKTCIYKLSKQTPEICEKSLASTLFTNIKASLAQW